VTLAESTDLERSWRRLDGVDILRGLAIFFVMMNHVNIRLLIAKVPYTARLPQILVPSLVWNAQFGVQIFFAVSGFLITSTSLRRWGALSNISVRDFYRLRFARIAPLFLLLLCVLSILHFAQFKNFIVPPKFGGLGGALFAAITFHINVLEANRGYLPGNWDVLWSLSVEEMFYLVFPLVARLLGRGKLLVALLLGLIVIGPFGRTVLARGNEIWSEYSYLGRMDAIAFGCLTALIVSRIRFSIPVIRMIAGVGIASLIFILGFSNRIYRTVLGRSGLEMTIVAVGACLVIAAAAQTQWRSPRFLSPLVTLGRRSYEVYLLHMFVVFALFNAFVAIGKPMGAVPVLFVAVILIASAFGDLAARFYSEPMNRLLRRRSAGGQSRLGSVIDGERVVLSETHLAP